MIGTRGWFRDLPVIDGAAEGMDALAEVGDVWICTKPMEVNPSCRDDKAAWVADHLGDKWLRRLIIAIPLRWFKSAEWSPVMFATSWNGEGSEWAGVARWKWGDPIEDLLKHAKKITAADLRRVDL